MTSALPCVNPVHLQRGFSELIGAACCSPQTRQNDLPRPFYTQPRKAERQEIASGEQADAGNGAGALLFQIGHLGRAVPDLIR